MPKTKFQEAVYGVLMMFFMVLAMELYNTGLRESGLTNAGFLTAFREMAVMFPVCFVMGFFMIDRLAPKIAFRMVTPGVDRPVFVTMVRASVTVAFMCPIMSFWATLIFKQPGAEFIPCGCRRSSAIFRWHFSGRCFTAVRWSAFCSGRFSARARRRQEKRPQARRKMR